MRKTFKHLVRVEPVSREQAPTLFTLVSDAVVTFGRKRVRTLHQPFLSAAGKFTMVADNAVKLRTVDDARRFAVRHGFSVSSSM